MDSGTIAKQLQEYDAKRVTSADAINEALKQFGVPEIRNTVSGLRTTVANTTNALKNVDPSVTGRTSGSLVTEAQRQRQVVNERTPIAEQLGQQTGALGTQEQTLRDSLDQANTLASGRVRDWETGRTALQSRYDTAYKREQDAAEAARQQAALQEQIRQFNEQQATTRGSSRYSGSDSTAAATPGSQQRKDGGFNFQDASGNAISARKYAQLTGTNFNTLLKKMAAAGDKGAQDVLKNGGSAKSYKALTWN